MTESHTPVSQYVCQRVADLLDERRVVVWYDSERVFEGLLDDLRRPGRVVVSASGSTLRARRHADAAYRRLDDADGSSETPRCVLIYVPAGRGTTAEAQQADPFEALARCGAPFGAGEAEGLRGLAHLALPAHDAEIDRLFREGVPTLSLLDALPSGARFPLVRQALDVESPAEAMVGALSHADTATLLEAVPGAVHELGRLADTAIGLPPAAADSWPSLRDRLTRYLLVSELAFSLPGGLPESLAAVAHAGEAHRQRILDICDRWRGSDAGRETYAPVARAVERDLRLPAALGADPHPPLGDRDTFPGKSVSAWSTWYSRRGAESWRVPVPCWPAPPRRCGREIPSEPCSGRWPSAA